MLTAFLLFALLLNQAYAGEVEQRLVGTEQMYVQEAPQAQIYLEVPKDRVDSIDVLEPGPFDGVDVVLDPGLVANARREPGPNGRDVVYIQPPTRPLWMEFFQVVILPIVLALIAGGWLSGTKRGRGHARQIVETVRRGTGSGRGDEDV